MSLYMSESLKNKIDVKDLEQDTRDLKVDTTFYCLFETEHGRHYAELSHLKYNASFNLELSFYTEKIDNDSIAHILDFDALKSLKVFLSNTSNDVCIEHIRCDKSGLKLSSIERASFSGYNYLITIIINEM